MKLIQQNKHTSFLQKNRKVRLVTPEGGSIVCSQDQAVAKAAEYGLDLIEVDPNGKPPVCKIMDYGKFKYEQKKSQKKQQVVKIKELQLRLTTQENDIQVRLKKAKEFLEDGDKVKFVMAFEGRELGHRELGQQTLARIAEELKGLAKVEQPARMDGRFMSMILSGE